MEFNGKFYADHRSYCKLCDGKYACKYRRIGPGERDRDFEVIEKYRVPPGSDYLHAYTPEGKFLRTVCHKSQVILI